MMERVPPNDDGDEAADDISAGGATDNTMSGTVSGPVVQAGRIGALHIHAEAARSVIPRALPKDVRAFVDRDGELARLDELVAQAHAAGQPAFALVTGVGRVGKTATAVHWA